MKKTLQAGAASVNITPTESLHLFGYPHVERDSTGINDPLFSSALCIRTEDRSVLFIANDIIFVSKDLVARARTRIHAATDILPQNILISATHTHSGPDTVAYASNEADSTVSPPDKAYVQQLEDGIVTAGIEAYEQCALAEIAYTTADASCVGSNRRDPAGPAHSNMPVMVVRNSASQSPIAVMWICTMHPTVLHEDSTLISGDFPGYARDYVQRELFDEACVVLHHSGASGNQSPRHVITSTTFAEAKRLGDALGKSVATAIGTLSKNDYHNTIEIYAASTEVTLPLRSFIAEEEALETLENMQAIFQQLQANNAATPAIRTAECDVFGAEETLTLSRINREGRLDQYVESCMPAEIQRITIGPWDHLAFPGELFVEYALDIEEAFPNAHVITLANGELQGYIVTEEAVKEGGYEANNALFASPEGGKILVDAAKALLSSDHA